MPNEWVVVELSPRAEGEDPELIRASIRHLIRDAEVFLPVSVSQLGDDRVIHYLVDGYAFIRRVSPEPKYLRLEGTKYVQSIITRVVYNPSDRPVRELACVGDDAIDRFKSQLFTEEDQGISIGDTVLVTSGPYKQIHAVVIEDMPDTDSVQVHVKFRSKESLVTLPRSCLKLLEKASRAGFPLRVASLREWLTRLRPAALFDSAPLVPLRNQFQVVRTLSGWLRHGTRLHAQINLRALPGRPLSLSVNKYGLLSTWCHRGIVLANFVRSVMQPPILQPLESAYLRWLWLDDLLARHQAIQSKRDSRKDVMIDNILIDGHNLAIRCATVPGLDTLQDAQGRPTGAIVGFLRSLGSFLKRFPGGRITVVWDGSSQRRRSESVLYKANRKVLRSYFEIEYLKLLLPVLGIQQVWNPEEEADDVLATLIRGHFKGQHNVVISTDHDFLQLVSQTDHLFIPAVGAGKEKMFDPMTVEQTYGVGPERMVQVRALSGDTSDNLPGVAGFGLKTASKLIQLYGTVEGVLESNLAGLTPNQYKKLRAAEATVRLNVKLMTLQTDLSLTWVSARAGLEAATKLLRDVNVRVDPFLPAFFPAGSAS